MTSTCPGQSEKQDKNVHAALGRNHCLASSAIAASHGPLDSFTLGPRASHTPLLLQITWALTKPLPRLPGSELCLRLGEDGESRHR